jgi:hypothetical protein
MSNLLDKITAVRASGITHPGHDVEGWDIAPHVVEAHVAQGERAKEKQPFSISLDVMRGDEILDVLARPDLRDAWTRVGAKVTISIQF